MASSDAGGTQDLQYYEFLGSEMLSLCTKNFTRSFKIHRTLLESKSNVLKVAFGQPFQEGQRVIYSFKETSEGTLVRFIEWAYRGEYSDEIDFDLDPDIPASECRGAVEHHPLVHVQLYIFSQTYLIPKLKRLAFDKLCARLTAIGRSEEMEVDLAIISVLRLAFKKTSFYEELHDWLAHYVSYHISWFETVLQNYGIFEEAPNLASMMYFLEPAPLHP